MESPEFCKRLSITNFADVADVE